MKKLPIFMYHSIDSSGSVVSVAPQKFADQMACLADLGCRGISLSEAVAYRQSNGSWPDKTIVLTFDDGYANLYKSAFPILAKYSFSATFFLVSAHVGKQNDWAPPLPDLGLSPLLSWKQVTEMASAGMEMGAHTQTHRDLRRLPENEVVSEIVNSRVEIEQRLSKKVGSFAYPFGRLNRTAAKIAAKEFEAACTTILQVANGEAMHLLPRVDMYYLPAVNDLKLLFEGRLDRYLKLRRLGRAVKSALASPF
jgi:peptidoglycan/xylan/chitin deacetylase (PgdA/CDA1 family)